ncbi:MAG TPA: alpha-galactosidase [Candidatus Blautia faecavium]|uniref:Alpha-galactosidase n=1 Tax=Candidatus Blautia faecavium TaxID=2838487 RepID=A0A9D2LUE5_9FIRM|nr:alpha-galactosidase [Candidatus Blautia faecavium]
MAILLDENKRLFSLCTKNSMYQMKVDNLGVLLHTYYGKRTGNFDYSYLISCKDRGFAGNPYQAGTDRTYSLEVLPQEYSCYGSGDYRSSALKIRYHMGARALELRYVDHQCIKGKYAIPGLPSVYAQEENKADTLVITLKDDVGGVYVHLYYGVMEDLDMITRTVRIENQAEHPIYLERALSMCLDQMYGNYDFLTFYGKHEMERKLSRAPIHHGVQSVGSVRGTSSHHYNPFMILADREATETQGNCYGFAFLYSGNFLGEAEYDQFNQTRVLMGIHPDGFEFGLLPGEDFWAPEVAMVYSDAGFEKMSHTFHYAFRNNLCRGKYKNVKRPVLLNNWEGTYFDFTGEKLIEMAKEAAKLGVELFVMDDGWFGKRDSDNSGLGDWYVNEKKLGCTLGELSDEIHKLGLKFGIWFEPECVSEDSDLYREHPDWAFIIPGRKPMRGRYQLVLDFSREEIRDHIYRQVCAVLDSAKVEYLKWDFNRSISDVYSAALPADRQGEVSHRYVLGLYDFLEKLTSRYPDLLIEGCSGGGGRFDAGMLYYTPQIWCSDDTDAIERLKIQYGTSFAYPISTVGAHVSACPNHQTGRSTPLETRAAVAMAGTFGYELNPMKLTQEEKEQIRHQIADFKKYYDLIQYGKYFRLTNPFVDEVYNAWEYVREDKGEALVSVVATKLYANEAPVYIRLRGLKENKMYRINGEKYLGAALMYAGLLMPEASEEYQSWNFHFVEE